MTEIKWWKKEKTIVRLLVVSFCLQLFSSLICWGAPFKSDHLLGDNSFDGQGIYFYTCMYYPTWAWGNTLHEFFLYFLSDFPYSISKGFPRFRTPVCILSVFVTSAVDLQKRSLLSKASFYSGIKEGRW